MGKGFKNNSFFCIMLKGGSMKYPIDEDTFSQIFGSESDYDTFLKENPVFTRDESVKKEKKKKTTSEWKSDNIKSIHSIDDFYQFLYLTWLELYLPRYELKYGEFQYSKDSEEMTNLEKINELLDYFVDCGVGTNIEEIRKSSFRGFKK